ncbi:hypothetical protein P8452_44138 [Trifolium repens]|nr:hypothetical protein P8452_44138 [Trifolium repens]
MSYHFQFYEITFIYLYQGLHIVNPNSLITNEFLSFSHSLKDMLDCNVNSEEDMYLNIMKVIWGPHWVGSAYWALQNHTSDFDITLPHKNIMH